MSEIQKHYDIVIVGSGAGGGTVAAELAPLCEQGLKIAVLEFGGRFKKADNTRTEFEMAQKYYFDGGGFQTKTQDMTLAFAHGVGGSTNVYTGVTFKIPELVLNRWEIGGLDYRDMNPRMEKFIKECNVHALPPEKINRNNQLFKIGGERLGWEIEQFPLNIKGCAGLNTCNLGCPRHAKQGTAVVQLPAAEQKGVETIPFCRVDRIDGSDVLADVVDPTSNLEPSPWKPGRYRIHAKKTLLCAGTIHTSAILLRSFGKKWNPLLGKYISCHPALMLAAEHDEPVNGTLGHPKSYYCKRFAEKMDFLLETCMYFPFSLAKNLAGFGSEVDELLHRYPFIQMILTLVLDEAQLGNRVDIDRKGNPIVHYQISETLKKAFVESIKASARLFFSAGAKRAHLPGANEFFTYAEQVNDLDSLITTDQFKLGKVSISAAHLMGGCRMGSSISDSVTNSWGKVHGKEHLYVADASLFPSCSRVNPYLTVMALADRVAEGIKNDLGMEA